MVVFTCQKCGDSLQKPKVEKHIQFVCRGSPLLSCVDCLKDFRGSEYVGHTQCVTETERYSAKGFTPKPNSQKGLNKQNLWNDIVKEVLKRQDLGVEERRLLNDIHIFQNIPRKRSKFHNFMKSATRCNPSSADAVFDLLETEWHNLKKNREGEDMSSLGTGTGKCESVNICEKESGKDSSAEAQKKSLNNIQNEALRDECKGGKLSNESVAGKQLSKKEKKQKRKRDKYLAEVNSIENNKNVETVEEKEINAHKKSKKKKISEEINMAEENVNIDIQEGLIEGVSEKKKKKKKKRKHSDNSNEDIQNITSKKLKMVQSEGTEHKKRKEQEVEEAKGVNKSVFSWSDTIIQILQSRSDKELSLKRLCKKILAEYQAVKGEELYESYEKLVAKFNKKVNKTVGVKVIEDKAKLVT